MVEGKGYARGRPPGGRPPGERSGHGVLAAGMQRVAAQQTSRGQPQAGEQAVPVQGFRRIVRTRRVEAAAAVRPEKHRQQRCDGELVESDRANAREPRQPRQCPAGSGKVAAVAPNRGGGQLTSGLTIRQQGGRGFSENVFRGWRTRGPASLPGPKSRNRVRGAARAGACGRVRAGGACSGCARQPDRPRATPKLRAGPGRHRRGCAPRAGTSPRRFAGRFRARCQNRRCAARVASAGGGGGPAERQTTVRRLRPLRRREASTLRPPRVDMRARNPILRTRFFLCGR